MRNNTPGVRDLRRMRREEKELSYRPLVSIVLPVHDPERLWLERALDSVLSQTYPNWELCVADDASTEEHVRRTLARYERLDDRIKVEYLEQNAGVSGASNAALSLAVGEFVGMLDHDDELAPDALFEVVKLLQERPEADLIYSDEDHIDEEDRRSRPHFKPGWSPDLLLCHNYITHLATLRREIVEEIGGFREGFEGSQDYDLLLRFTEKTQSIHHIPKVLYHWRMVEGSVTTGAQNKPYTHERSRQALSEALERRGVRGTVESSEVRYNFFRVRREIEGLPKVSILIPTRDNAAVLKTCVESIERLTTYHNYEIVVVDNESEDPKTLEYLRSIPHRVLEFGEPFNYSRINNFAVSRTDGEYVLLLNDDTEVISGGWLEAMLEHAQRPEVGAVGAKLLYPEGLIQHAGVVLGTGSPWVPGTATHSHLQHPADAPGHAGAVITVRNYSAVTAACAMFRREVLEELGGFDEENLKLAFNDVDLCLRMRERGYLIVYTPYARLYHHESLSRGDKKDPSEGLYMRERWGEVLDRDPYYNPNFSRGAGSRDFNLRADLLRPRQLTSYMEENFPTSQDLYRHPAGLEPGERSAYMRDREMRARDSGRTTLIPAEDDFADARADRNERYSRGARVSQDQLVWMFGAPRTGSTWLSQMMGELKGQRLWSEPLVGMLFGSFIYGELKNNEGALNGPNMIMGKPYREVWLDSIKSFIIDGATARYPELKREQYIVVKEPNGSAGAPVIVQATPESRLIFLVRDSRDAVASRLEANKKGNWGQQRGVNLNWEYDTPEKLHMYTRQAAEQYLELISLVKEAYAQHPGKKVLVRYEDLCREPFNTLKNMYEALEIEVDEARLRRAVEKHSWENIPEEKKGQGKFYRKGSPGSWREDLSREQIKIVEDVTAPILSEFYEPGS